MNDTVGEFERLLGHAALKLWPDLPRDVQELLFETAVPIDPTIRNRLAVFLHDRHPRTAHPPKPTQLAVTERDHGFGAIHWVARAFAMVVVKYSNRS
jgi:hypothetical protein